MMYSAALECMSIPFKRGRDRIGCVAFDKKGRILGSATNSYSKTHPEQAKYAQQVGLDEKIYLHAEIACIIRAQKLLKKDQSINLLSIARLNRKNEPLNSKPCPICIEAIKEAGVEKIEYFDGGELIIGSVDEILCSQDE